MRDRCWLWLIAIALGFFSIRPVQAAALDFPGLTVVAPDDRQADPGGLVVYCFEVTNRTTGQLTLTVSWQCDQSWPVIDCSGDIALVPGEETIIPLSLLVPSDAAAGALARLSLILAWQQNGIEAARVSVVTTVLTRHFFTLNAPDSAVSPRRAILDLPFVLHNQGNTPDTYLLEAISDLGSVYPARTTVEASANEAKAVHFSLSIPGDLPPDFRFAVTVTAVSAATGETASARVFIREGPAAEPGQARLSPLIFALFGQIGLEADSSADPNAPDRIWFDLAGNLGLGRRLELFLSGIFSSPAGLADSFIYYNASALAVRAGNFTSPWSGSVNPGTAEAGLDLIARFGANRLELIVGTPAGPLLELNPIWSGLLWANDGKIIDWSVQLLQTTIGVNAAGGPFLGSSLNWLSGGSDLSLQLEYGLGPGNPSALTAAYNGSINLGKLPLDLWAKLLNSRGVNTPEAFTALSVGAGYAWGEANLLTIELTGQENDGLERHLLGQGKISLKLGGFLDAYLLAKGDWREDADWEQAGSGYHLGVSFASRPGDPLGWRVDLDYQWETISALSASGLHLEGSYAFLFQPLPGTWSAGLRADLLDSEYSGRLHLGYRSPESNPHLTYEFSLDYPIDEPLTAAGKIRWELPGETILSGSFSLSAGDLALCLQLVHAFALSLPKPEASLSGFVYQDLDGNALPGAGEPGLAGVWILVDGTRAVMSGADGYWALTGVPPGGHQVAAASDSDPQLTGRTAPIAIAVSAGQKRDLSLPMWRLTSLSGGLYLDGLEGEPIETLDLQPRAGVVLILTRPDGTRDEAVTASDGTFLFPDLPPGRYRLETDGNLDEGVIPPASQLLAIDQQGAVELQLIAKRRVKPVVVTYVACPQIAARVVPTQVAPGGTIRLTITSDLPLVRVEITFPGQPVQVYEAPGDDGWQGELQVPAALASGPAAIAVRGWASTAEPGTASVTIQVLEPLALQAHVFPEKAPPGGRLWLTVTASAPLRSVTVSLPWKGSLLSLVSQDGLNWSGEIDLPVSIEGNPLILEIIGTSRSGGLIRISLPVQIAVGI